MRGAGRKRFLEHRIAGLGDIPRSGGPRTVTDEQVTAVVKRTLETAPKNATHWSTRAMATEMGLSRSTVCRRSGGPSACGHTAQRRSSCRRTRNSSTRAMT
ncbi:helix-turn-helix domain-containing protein [Streptomyces sp. NPDC056568]|uniref:helix-turn-helix domain-containing protein n=1 Tax=Streptomyces sp. NPDC056568 TaxID=3345866 RepID=UPI0036BC4ABE